MPKLDVFFAVRAPAIAPSQLELGLEIGMGDTLISRIERALNFSSWDKIYIHGKYVNITTDELFSIKTRDELLDKVEKSLKLELTQSTAAALYYENVKEFMRRRYF